MLEQIILGILQGIFEWLPVSSEGAVALASQFFGGDFNPVELALFLHLGTLLAAVIYFRKDWKEVILLRNPKLFRFLLIATLISLIIGYPLFRIVRNAAVGSNLLLIVGFSLLITAYFQKKEKKLEISFGNLAVITGILQGLSVIPGFSRSGATIFGLSLGRVEPAEILKISYMLSIPVVLASVFYLLLDNPSLVFKNWLSLIFSFLAGIAALSLLLKFAEKTNFFRFALIFGVLCILGGVFSFLV